MGGDGMEISADTPVGRLAAKGVRVSDLIGLLTLMGVSGAIYFSWQTSQSLTEHEKQANVVSMEIATSIRDAARSQRMMTCILSVSQERREQEFMQPNGYCHQISQMP